LSSLAFCPVAEATTCGRPDFSGEVWGASIDLPGVGPSVVYWVFEEGSFSEYLHSTALGKTRLIASGRYTAGPDSYFVLVQSPGDFRGKRASKSSSPVRTLDLPVPIIELPTDGSGLLLPNGQLLARVLEPDQWLPTISAVAASDEPVGKALYSSDCCIMCYAVHETLGISWANGICCFFAGGCGGGGGGFGGGGASGEW
jgi:uncharacterized membrane protein YgcG